MSSKRFIHCIGTSDEDTAHVRLLLRLVQTRTRDSWTWGPEAKADLVIVDTRKVVGETALRRAAQRGSPCARIIEAKEPPPSGPFLRKPLQRDAFASLLARIEDGADPEPETGAWDDGMAEMDLGMIDLSSLEAAHPGAQRGYGPSSFAGEKRPDLEPAGIADLSAHLVGSATTGTPGGQPASAGEAAHGALPVVEPAGDADAGPPRIEAEFVPQVPIDPNATFPLVYYLEKGVLGGPARISLLRRPPLVIDPEAQMFWAQGLLSVLEPYVREPLRYGDWELLDRTNVEKARSGMAVRPFTRLVWLDAFVNSNGFLAKHFDPRGDFRLTNRIDFSMDFPLAFRVGTCMSGVARKLHEVSRLTAVGLEDVFNIVNAYDALGYVEGTRR